MYIGILQWYYQMRRVNLMNGKENRKMEVMDEMAISEKEMKLLMNFVKDDLKEARDSEDVEKKNSKIDRVLEHIQQYLED